jgi:hypothetical protein
MGLLDIFKKDNKPATKNVNPNDFVSNSYGNPGQQSQVPAEGINPINNTPPVVPPKEQTQNIPPSLDGSFAQATNLAKNYSSVTEPAPKFPSNKPIPSVQYAPPPPSMNNSASSSGSTITVGTSNLKSDPISEPLPQNDVVQSIPPSVPTDVASSPLDLDTTFIEPIPQEDEKKQNDLIAGEDVSLTTSNFRVNDSNVVDKTVAPSIQQTNTAPMDQSTNEVEVTSGTSDSELDLEPVVTEDAKTDTQEKELPELPINKLTESEIEVARNAGLKVLNKIALLGLQNVNTPKQEVLDLITYLEPFSPTLIFETNKGLVQEILPLLKEKKIRNTGVYLKPFLSNEADVLEGSEVDTNVNIIHSNPFDKMKQLFREAKVFIAFESSSLSTMMEVFSIWFTASLYKGQEKPLILFGTKWNTLLDTLKNNQFIDAQSFESIKVMANLEEFKTYFTNLDNDYANKKRINLQKVFDRRVEGDEGDYIIK